MGMSIDVGELLKTMDTWDKFGNDPNKGLIPLRTPALQDRYVPYVKYDDMVNCVNGMPSVEAIPIPKGATNGDILRTIFPKAKHELQKFYEEDTIVFDLDGFYMRISSDWWNSPYKENIENGKVD